MIHLFMRHKVPNYNTWHKAFVDFRPTMKVNGAVASAVYRAVNNPSDISVVYNFSTLEGAKAFADSGELKITQSRAGVDGTSTTG